jgi:hypothetical protein
MNSKTIFQCRFHSLLPHPFSLRIDIFEKPSLPKLKTIFTEVLQVVFYLIIHLTGEEF